MVDNLSGGGLVFGHLIALAPALFAAGRAWRFPRGQQLTTWMATAGADPHGPGRDLAASYLRRTRWVRTWGFIIGFCVLPTVWLWFTRDARRQNEWPSLTVGLGCFAVSIVLAELVRPRPAADSSTTAPPIPKSAYAPAFTRIDPFVIAGLFVVMIVWSIVAQTFDTRIAVLTGAATMGWVVTFALQRWILSRPQVVGSEAELRVEDAIRSTSVINATAFGYMASLASLGAGLVHLSGTTPAGVSTLALLGVGAVIVAIGVAFGVGLLRHDTGWVAQRVHPAG